MIVIKGLVFCPECKEQLDYSDLRKCIADEKEMICPKCQKSIDLETLRCLDEHSTYVQEYQRGPYPSENQDDDDPSSDIECHD